jgi:hypothetical protein
MGSKGPRLRVEWNGKERRIHWKFVVVVRR